MADANTIRDQMSPTAQKQLDAAVRDSGMSETDVLALIVENTLAPRMPLDETATAEIRQGLAEANASRGRISSAAMGAWVLSLGTDQELAPPEPDIQL